MAGWVIEPNTADTQNCFIYGPSDNHDFVKWNKTSNDLNCANCFESNPKVGLFLGKIIVMQIRQCVCLSKVRGH